MSAPGFPAAAVSVSTPVVSTPAVSTPAADPSVVAPAPGHASGGGPTAPAAPLTVPALVARHAERHPNALAVTDGSTTLTYRQLVSAAARLAAELTARGIGPDAAVGLLAARSTRLVVAQLAVWWTGAHTVPLDAAYPVTRTAAMVEDAGVRLVLGDKTLLDGARLAATVPTLALADPDPQTGPARSAGAAPVAPVAPAATGPDAVALVIYTSGSTGRPKGVQVPHRAVADLVTAADAVALRPGDRVLFHSPATFDASTFEIWGPLARGAAVAVSPAERPGAEELARDIERFGVTTVFLTTALFHHLAARRSRIFGVLRTLVVGGESLSPEHAGAVLRAFPWLELLNAYGPTEATTFTTLHPIRPADCTGPIPIGRPFGSARTLVLDERGAPVPAGTRGELWIGGGRLALGYLDRPELTAERFRDLPGLGRLYRSGDLVSERPDGTIEFHGRSDDQVKVRGFRIEPGEIEYALRQQSEIADAAVVVRRPGREDAALTAFVVPAEGVRPATETLRRRLAEQLPAHLVPTAWTLLDALPLTGTGKVDRRALAADGFGSGGAGTGPAGRRSAGGADATTGPVPDGEARPVPVPATAPTAEPGVEPGVEQAAEPGVEPAAEPGVEPAAERAADAVPGALGPIEQVVADAWSRALERPVTGPDADFLAEGGHSLLAMWIIEDLREDLGVELPLGDFLDHPTVAGQAALLERALLAAHGTATVEPEEAR